MFSLNLLWFQKCSVLMQHTTAVPTHWVSHPLTLSHWGGGAWDALGHIVTFHKAKLPGPAIIRLHAWQDWGGRTGLGRDLKQLWSWLAKVLEAYEGLKSSSSNREQLKRSGWLNRTKQPVWIDLQQIYWLPLKGGNSDIGFSVFVI